VEYATLDNISRQDLLFRRYFHPNNMILGIVGDFDSEVMRAHSKEVWDWKPSQMPLPKLPSVSQFKQGGVFLVNQPQLTQLVQMVIWAVVWIVLTMQRWMC